MSATQQTDKMTLSFFLYYVVLRLLSDAALVPALWPLLWQRRHFPLFVALVQLLAIVLYDTTLVFSWNRLFIKSIEWHFISDVLNLTYGINVCIHLANFKSEEVSTVLRYLGFFLSWIFKYKDTWNGILAEMLLVIAFMVITIVSHLYDPAKRSVFRKEHLTHALAAGVFGFICFFSCQRVAIFDATNHPYAYPIVLGLSHISLGYASYNVWNVLPPIVPRHTKPTSLGSAGTSFV